MKYALCLLVLSMPSLAATNPPLKKVAPLKHLVIKKVLMQKRSPPSKKVAKAPQVRQAVVVERKTAQLQSDLASLKEALKAICSKDEQNGQATSKK